MKQISDEVLQAIARGWCHQNNSAKAVDYELTTAIHAEVMKALDTAQPEPVLTDKEQIAKNKRELLKQMQAQPERAPLADDEIIKIGHSLPQNKPLNLFEFARAVEAAIKQGGQHD